MNSFSSPSFRKFTKTVFGTAGIISLVAIIFAVSIGNGMSFDFRSKAARGEATYKTWDFQRNNGGWTSTNAINVSNGKLLLKSTLTGQKALSENPATLRITKVNTSLPGVGAKRIEILAKVYPQMNGTVASIPVTVRYRRQQDTTMRTLPTFTLAVNSLYNTGIASFSELESFILGDIEIEFPKYNNISIERVSVKGTIVRTTPKPTSMPTVSLITSPTGTIKPVSSATPTMTPTSIPKSTAPSTPTPMSSSYIYNADFETGNFQSLTGNTAWEGPIGAYFGKGVFHEEKVVSSPAIGKYAASITIGSGSTTAGYLFTYKVPTAATATYGADFYIPSTITPSSWWNVWQWKSVNQTYPKPIVDLNLLKINGVLQLVMFHNPGGVDGNTKTFYQSAPKAFPTNAFVHVEGVYTAKTDTTGSIIISQDGTKIFELTGIMTKPGGNNVLWSINSYADAITPNPATIYVDNMTIR